MPEPAPEGRERRATVLESLPSALYRVELASGRRDRLTVHAAPGLLRVRPGDVVMVEVSAEDGTRGRIVRIA